MINADVSKYRQVVTLAEPGAPVADGDGGYTEAFQALDPPTWRCAIEAASVRAAEQHFAATVIAHADYMLRGRYHAGISTKTRMAWVDRSGATHLANVLDVDDPEGAGVVTVVLVSEVVDTTTPAPPESWMQAGWTQ